MPYIEHRAGQAVTEQELEQQLTAATNGVIYLEGPDRCGKTALLRRVAASRPDTKCLAAEALTRVVLDTARRRLDLEQVLSTLQASLLCLEDVDRLTGRITSLEMLAEAVGALGRTMPVVITGRRLVGVLYVTPDAYYVYKN